jgi:SAM-dependent methyltransferase
MTASAALRQQRMPADDLTSLWLRCPRCSAGMSIPPLLQNNAVDGRVCARCSSSIKAIDGIWKTILPARAREIAPSLTAYEAVREAEGRWSGNAEFYRALPFRDTTGRFESQWLIRARSYEFLRKHVLPECMKQSGKQHLRVLDLGAGNCWMSYRLAQSGHLPVAIDIGVGRKDGLGAALHYASSLKHMFPRFQAEMDQLPFMDGQFDLAIYNASLHYAQDYETTVREAVRVLRPGGAIAIVDSPSYDREADGEAMMNEKAAEFSRKFGTDSGGMGGQGYLTPRRLAHLERIGIHWRRYSPWYGWRWASRPLFARLSGRRKPSRFYIYLGTLASELLESE